MISLNAVIVIVITFKEIGLEAMKWVQIGGMKGQRAHQNQISTVIPTAVEEVVLDLGRITVT